MKISKRGKIIARIIPEKIKSKEVDWSKSAALTMDRSNLPFLTPEQKEMIIHDGSSKW